eukprot:TRINITY_DN22299_c0_g1_i1.p1 TRINITY_DN22299_c0_g1~~TRINITY_DN22299_c0_g1_i1.p1  ORF type:complete len:1240 (+),score=418.60 TRINITY_DN22299_c0_g1_i1:75-3794(+)
MQVQEKLHRQVCGLREVLAALEAEDEYHDLQRMYREDVKEAYWLASSHLRWALRGLSWELAEKITAATNNTQHPNPQRKDWENLTWLATLATRERRSSEVKVQYENTPIYPPAKALRLRVTILSMVDYNVKAANFRRCDWENGLGVTVYIPASQQISLSHFTHSPYFVPEIKERGDRVELFGGYTFNFDIPIPDWRAEGYGKEKRKPSRDATPLSWTLGVGAVRPAKKLSSTPISRYEVIRRRRERRRGTALEKRPNETQLNKVLLAELGKAVPQRGAFQGAPTHLRSPVTLPTSPQGVPLAAPESAGWDSYPESESVASTHRGPVPHGRDDDVNPDFVPGDAPQVIIRTPKGHATLPLLPLLDGVGVGAPPPAERHGLLLSNRKAQLDVVTEVDLEWWRGWRRQCKEAELKRAQQRETAYMTHHFLLTQQHTERQAMARCDFDAKPKSEGGNVEVATPVPEFSLLERVNRAPFKLHRSAPGRQGEGVVKEELGLAHAASTVYGYPPKLAVAGGLITHTAHANGPVDKETQFSNHLYEVNLVAGKTETLPQCPVERLHASLVHHNGRLYLYGGLGWYRRGEETFERSGALVSKWDAASKDARRPARGGRTQQGGTPLKQKSTFCVVKDEPARDKPPSSPPTIFSPKSTVHLQVPGQHDLPATPSNSRPRSATSSRLKRARRSRDGDQYIHLDNVSLCSSDGEHSPHGSPAASWVNRQRGRRSSQSSSRTHITRASLKKTMENPASSGIYTAKDEVKPAPRPASASGKKAKAKAKEKEKLSRTYDALMGDVRRRRPSSVSRSSDPNRMKGVVKRLYQSKDEQDRPVLYKTVLEYSFASQVWTEIPTTKGRHLRLDARDVPLYRASHTACMYGHYMLVFGGWGVAQPRTPAHRSNFLTWLSLRTGRWRSFPGHYTTEGWVSEKGTGAQKAPQPRSDHTAVMVKENMYVLGGTGHMARQRDHGRTESPPPAAESTHTPPGMPTPTTPPASPAEGMSFRKVNLPQTDADCDSSDADTPWARHMKSYATITSHAQALSDLWRYNASTHEWTQLPECPVSLSGHAASVWGQTMFVCGGKGAPHVHAFSFPHNTWCLIRTARVDPKPLRRWGHMFSVHPRVVNRRTVLTLCSIGGEWVPTANTHVKKPALSFDYPKKPAPDSEEAEAQKGQLIFNASACYHIYEHPVMPLTHAVDEEKEGKDKKPACSPSNTPLTPPRGSSGWGKLRQKVLSQRNFNRQAAAMAVD